MKTLYTLLGVLAISSAASAQCLTISCNSNTSVNNDPQVCGAVVSYTTPTITNYSCAANVTQTFNYTGAQQTFVVPAGVTSVTIGTWGAQGGANWVNNVNYGGHVQADIAVTPGSTLYIYVGGQPNSTAGGFNGGGSGETGGKGGGGGTDVRIGGTTYNDRVVCAGGGGGAGYWSGLHVYGGVGGGLTGGDGYREPDFASNPGGKGASQSGPGPDGTCASFNITQCAGGFGFGGSITGCGCEVYGGGGGWYGGAASGNCRGGGGGSGYAIPAATNVVMDAGVRAGHGMVTIAYSVSPTLSQTAGLPSGAVFPVGTTTNTFIGMDASGNADTCTFTVTVNDTEAPVLSNMPSSVSVSNDASQCTAIVTWTAPTVTDNCSGATASSDFPSGHAFPVGTTTVTYTATDASGNTDIASFTVTVTDTEAPLAICPMNITVSADSGQCSASNVQLSPVLAMDNCGAVTVTNDAPATYPVGITTVTTTVTDAAGNTATCSQDVTVVDDQAPVFNLCPQGMSMCEGEVTFNMPSASDNCSAMVSQVSGPASGSQLTAGTYTVVFVATDNAGNTDSCSFTITVNATPVVTTSNPAIVCVMDGNLTLSGSPAGGVWSGTAVTGNIFSPTTAGSGTYLLTYTYTDANGCEASASDSITVTTCPGISEFGKTTFTMFPNPASTAFTFSCNEHGTVELVDAAGKVVLAKTVTATQTEINITGVATGLYIVRFTSTSGAISTGKLQVQH